MKQIFHRVTLALLLTATVAGCSRSNDPAPAPTTSVRTLPTPVAGRFTGFANPCPTVRGRVGTQLSSLNLSISLRVECGFGDRGRRSFPKFDSRATINRPTAAQGAPDTVTAEIFGKSKTSDQAETADGTTVEDRSGLGDQAYLLVSNKGNATYLVIRSANVLISVGGHVDRISDEAKEIAELKALEPQLTELAQALLAQLQ